MKVPRKQAIALGLTLIAGALVAVGISALKPGPSGLPADVPESAQPAEPAAADLPSRVDYGLLDERIAALMEDPDMVGLAIGTIERGTIRFMRGYGETLAHSGKAVTPDTVFRWASLSKGVAAALVVGLAEDGALSLDDRVTTFATTLSLPRGAGQVTVADILSHRVGLVRNAWDDRLEAGEDPKLLRAKLGSLPLFCAPATCHTYQNIAFDTVTEIAEGVSGEDYARFARRRLFAPLGMTSTSLGRAGLENAPDWARPHRKARTPTVVNDSYYRVPAAGGVNGSIRDLTRWMDVQMGAAPTVLSAKALALMQQPLVRTPPRNRRGAIDRALVAEAYGLGWRTFTYADRTLIGHRGSVDGYRSLILFDPADKSGIVILWNSNSRLPVRLQLVFLDMLYGLPFHDWLALSEQGPAPLETEAGDRAGNS